MMAAVRLIDILVVFLQVLGGRKKVHPVLRVAAWIALLAGAVAGFAAVGFGLVLLERHFSGAA